MTSVTAARKRRFVKKTPAERRRSRPAESKGSVRKSISMKPLRKSRSISCRVTYDGLPDEKTDCAAGIDLRAYRLRRKGADQTVRNAVRDQGAGRRCPDGYDLSWQ